MPQGLFSKIFNLLLEDGKVTVQTGTGPEGQKEHDLLRVRLCKHYSRHKTTMEELGALDPNDDLSVCATFTESSGLSEFSIGQRKRSRQTGKLFTIVDTGAPIAQEKEKLGTGNA